LADYTFVKNSTVIIGNLTIIVIIIILIIEVIKY